MEPPNRIQQKKRCSLELTLLDYVSSITSTHTHTFCLLLAHFWSPLRCSMCPSLALLTPEQPVAAFPPPRAQRLKTNFASGPQTIKFKTTSVLTNTKQNRQTVAQKKGGWVPTGVTLLNMTVPGSSVMSSYSLWGSDITRSKPWPFACRGFRSRKSESKSWQH